MNNNIWYPEVLNHIWSNIDLPLDQSALSFKTILHIKNNSRVTNNQTSHLCSGHLMLKARLMLISWRLIIHLCKSRFFQKLLLTLLWSSTEVTSVIGSLKNTLRGPFAERELKEYHYVIHYLNYFLEGLLFCS